MTEQSYKELTAAVKESGIALPMQKELQKLIDKEFNKGTEGTKKEFAPAAAEEMVDYKEFGKRLKAAMQEKKVTAAELAQEINVSEYAIERYIEGARVPRATKIIEMAKALGVTLDSLILK